MTDSEKLDLILSKLETLEQRTTNIESKVSNIEDKVNDINLTLENEIRVNIQRVAEGHLDLSRNLHEALRIDNEKEMLSIRVSVLETELRRIKERIESIA
jgi:chaperonin cofactor prefoldin